ncbi:hypothetical protein AGMMS50276_14660 [Synergistales bacterium]|nr:hypothetical protein AGMMS50276_14660 [Synergistales bacterium]
MQNNLDSSEANIIFGYETGKCWEYENGFYLTSSSTRIAKSIAHWELYKNQCQQLKKSMEYRNICLKYVLIK